MTCLFLFLVKPYQDELYIGSGEVASISGKGKHIHSFKVKQDEVVIKLIE